MLWLQWMFRSMLGICRLSRGCSSVQAQIETICKIVCVQHGLSWPKIHSPWARSHHRRAEDVQKLQNSVQYTAKVATWCLNISCTRRAFWHQAPLSANPISTRPEALKGPSKTIRRAASQLEVFYLQGGCTSISAHVLSRLLLSLD